MLRWPGRGWNLSEGHLFSGSAPVHEFQAVTRPSLSALREAKALRGVRTGWWHPSHRLLWIELGQGRWLQVDRMDEAAAFAMLDQLELKF
jgi:hypothetical protein